MKRHEIISILVIAMSAPWTSTGLADVSGSVRTSPNFKEGLTNVNHAWLDRIMFELSQGNLLEATNKPANDTATEGACDSKDASKSIVKLANVTYKKTVDINSNPVALKMYHRYQPKKVSEPLPAILLFFGGGWSSRNLGQMEEFCKYFAARGMICMAPDYRVSSVEGTSPYEAVNDAKSAVRWVRANASNLKIDPDRIIVGGGSAGGHIAACTEIITGYNEPGEDLSVSSKPNLLCLLNPVVDTTKNGYGSRRFTPETDKELSPFHHITPDVCPTIIFHGTDDTTVPFENVERFTQKMHDNSNTCKLVSFDGKAHGFFNHVNFRPDKDPADFKVCAEESFNFFIANDFGRGGDP
ncbi:Carboxylesterase NlhH [Anaerohalosphaera lusitana]|uniref:Carboxylesterase NlhH n=1 Tax=Anaerohalosphaera lusitana TaxID=1936003 RepID=A0A1U9NKQ3_9BACT|nr:alpha/beta hydrolase [Anaerohalosphaera lusitana]AQT68096.1 Carboxylesterase NlhH [Anaerohalosphaera lusitana]